MTLKQFIDDGWMTMADLARKVGHDTTTVWRWYSGQSIKGKDMAKIVKVSRGKVTLGELTK